MRLVFLQNKQKELIELAKINSGLTWNEMSKKLRLDECYIRISLRREKCIISFETFSTLCNLAKIPLYEWMQFVKDVRRDNWGQICGGKIGGVVHKPATKVNIKEPILSNKLAEFIGILLGDGSLSQGQYDCSIVLNRIYDAPYTYYVRNLIFNLFGVNCHFYPLRGGIRVTVYSKKLFDFLVGKMQIPYGCQDKFIPTYLLKSKILMRCALRGIFDTDGSVYLSSKKKIINIKSKCLKKDVMSLLDALKIRYHVSGENINITNHRDIKEFLSSVGSSNLKNIIKIIEFYTKNISVKNNPELLRKFNAYSGIKVPFTYIF
ncbi:hypothetical protein A3K64_00860 [Candidatus Micrarchaeota archaeon RBG_16_36_9]|nr:MAG: hypothetical protein A3K64_00860 [Candidatus Micrarchaeota archaeon RBG_16_36_9]